ncbi:Vacuolar import and degradation protein 27 [Gracilariopsis chorda]|uniref:Vacuolar import and degradation protein 27 n=1 Tax=Gracilariopsis chorda TaxID=448386 RepID=A0A2V3J0G3_9FLOR|nr:Vacuolar import and degradation protein 27 [Gracilariopsis chorda]|eukprot:PXF47902.1 Vacuolar import and degradation protein 27 [Gracilariopsis chorda]
MTQPFQHELVVSRANEESTEGDVFPADVVFPIDKSANLEAGDMRLGWSDRAGKRYNFDFEDQDSARDLTEAVASALFQNIHSRIPDSGDEEELRTILEAPPEHTVSDLLEAKGELARAPGELFKYDLETEQFRTMVPDVLLTINSAVVKEDNTRAYLLIVYRADSGVRMLETEISNDMNTQFYSQTMSVVWVLNLESDADAAESSDPSAQICLSVKFCNAEDFVTLRNQYTVCLYEVNHQASIEDLKLKNEDVTYIEDTYRDDVEPMEIDDEEPDENEDRRISEYDPNRRASMSEETDGMINSQLAVSANNDRTFVVRGNKMGVFATNDDGAAFRTTLQFKDQETGSLFNPSNVLLHERDRSMIVLDPSDPTKLRRMDLERGEIVDTWTGGLTGNTPVKAVQRAQKYSNLTDAQEFVGLNKNQLMRMDPRAREFVVQSKRYAASTRAKLECVATTGGGYLAVASENGDIRLFDQIGKNAKTHLPGLGDPIIGIDVSEDGNYVLATTKKYLLIIDTRVKGSEKGGFQKSMGKSKPAPRKLTIKNEDIVKYRMGEIQFTTAHFNTGSSLERSIVTSTGPFVVVWNFRAVKMGRLDSYRIRRYQDNIIADDFAYDNDGRIVVTLPNDVSVARR